jgi:hypothetical protein
MANDDGEGDGDSGLERDVLSFLGSWARLRDRMDWLVTSLLKTRLPELGDVIADRFMGGLNDVDRMTFFLAAAKEVNYSGDLTQFTGLFNRAKRIRNLVAHFYRVAVVYSEEDGCYRLQVSYSGDTPTKRLATLPDPFPPDGFQLLVNDCTWLMEHVERVHWENERLVEVGGNAPSSTPPRRPDPPGALRPLTQGTP